MSGCAFTLPPTSKDMRGRGLWCVVHQDFAPDYARHDMCRTAELGARAEAAEAERDHQTARAEKLQHTLDTLIERVHPRCTAEVCSTIAAIEETL